MSFILNPLQHMRAVRRWADAHNVHMHLSPHSMSLTLTRGKRAQRLVPRFVVQREGRLSYIRTFEEDGQFVGWHQADQQSWPLAQDKLTFKRTACAMGLLAPSAWNGGKVLADSFLVKNRAGSFGVEVNGPYRADSFDFNRALCSETYYEQFITGLSAKAWCWNGLVVVLELIEPACLTGNGVCSLGALADQSGNVRRKLQLETAQAILAWQGYSTNSVLADGQQALLDFKYASSFELPIYTNRNCWHQQSDKVKHQFARAAFLLQNCLPATLQKRGLFTLDAVLDTDGRAWFLEMNSHPMIHPDVYEPMLSTLMRGET